MSYYDNLGARSTPSPLSNPSRPGTVTAGLVILGIGVAIALIALVVGLGLIGNVPASPVRSSAIAALLVALGVVGLYAVALVLIARGYGWARTVIVVVGAIGYVYEFASGSFSLGIGEVLFLGAVILLCLPASSGYFREMDRYRRTASSPAGS